jgi:nicotinamide-nucleotide amidase
MAGCPQKTTAARHIIPEGAIPIPNPVGTAPCFIVEQDASFVISLPGVPQEMKHLLHQDVIPFLKQKFNLQSQIIKATVLHAASMGESVIDELIADLEEKFQSHGGTAGAPGQVDIRVTAKASSEDEANRMIQPILEEICIVGLVIISTGMTRSPWKMQSASLLEESTCTLGIIIMV